jgi:DNA-binding response OmpR family regulator
MRVLIVEDEPKLARNIAESFSLRLGYACDLAHDGAEGWFHARDGSYDLILLDLMLPKLSGDSLLQQLRNSGVRTPVLVLTARDDKATLVHLLDLGADDFLAKPFDLGELIARARALVRRSTGHASSVLTLADLTLNTATRQVHRNGRDIDLTPMEYRVLEYLLHHQGTVISKRELLEHLYDYNAERFSNVIEVHIAGLRRKIDQTAATKLIHTVRGHGYSLHREPDA